MGTRTLPKRDPGWIDAAPITVEVTRPIAADPAAVWALIADHAGWTNWFRAVRKVEVTGTAEGVGGTRRVTAAGMRFDEEFTAWEPLELFAFTVLAARPPLVASMAESVRLTAEGDTTVVTYRQGIEPRAGLGRFWRVAQRRMQAGLTEGLAGLAAAAERTTAPGA